MPLPDFAREGKTLRDELGVKSVGFKRYALWDHTGVPPDLVRFTREFLEAAHALAWPLRVHSALRTYEEQARLFARGVTKARPGTSAHNHGLAVDIIHALRAWDLTPREWLVIGALGKEVSRRVKVPVEWGGDWGWRGRPIAPGEVGWDPAHWQVADWKKRRNHG